MVKQSIILLLSSFVGLLGCNQKRSRPLSISVDQIVKDIAKDNVLKGPAVGIAGQRPKQWDRFEALRSRTTDSELLGLTNHDNAVVRCYAFQGLADRQTINLFPVLVNHLSDTATVHTLFGCVGDAQKVEDFFLAATTRNKGNINFYGLTNTQNVTIDSLLLFGEGNKLEARDKMLSTLPPLKKYYQRLKELAVEEDNKTAVVALAKYRKQEDKHLIERLLVDVDNQPYGFAAVRNFPHPSFFPVLRQALVREITKDNDNNIQRLQVLYEAIVQYKDPPSRRLLQAVLNESKGIQHIYHADYLHQALTMYPSAIYNGLLKPIYSGVSAEEGGM